MLMVEETLLYSISFTDAAMFRQSCDRSSFSCHPDVLANVLAVLLHLMYLFFLSIGIKTA